MFSSDSVVSAFDSQKCDQAQFACRMTHEITRCIVQVVFFINGPFYSKKALIWTNGLYMAMPSLQIIYFMVSLEIAKYVLFLIFSFVSFFCYHGHVFFVFIHCILCCYTMFVQVLLIRNCITKRPCIALKFTPVQHIITYWIAWCIFAPYVTLHWFYYFILH